jgi:Protein of unknown function (DUF1688)
MAVILRGRAFGAAPQDDESQTRACVMAALSQTDGQTDRPADIPPHDVPWLRSAAAVRERCRLVHDWVAQGRSLHFTLDDERLPDVAAYVAEVTRENYPDLAIPYHSRWRHFSASGVERWSELQTRLPAGDATERARAAVDLAAVSVLLDAGAGDAWRYREPATGRFFARSEGLAMASLDMFRAGGFSSDPAYPLRADSAGLQSIGADLLAHQFQAGAENPLVGVEARAALLRRLGGAIAERPDIFGSNPARPGAIVDRLLAGGPEVSTPALLTLLLDVLSPIWPSALVVGGVPLGDAGRHRAILAAGAADQVVPFHKLTQWLVYSLIEPLQWAGLRVVDLDGLTALAEYRNGGLLLDLGVIRPRRPLNPTEKHQVDSELIVEWRALTVTLMDRLLDPVRNHLGLGSTFVLPHMLQGGTWSAGRKIALALRPPGGPPPIAIDADGTVF